MNRFLISLLGFLWILSCGSPDTNSPEKTSGGDSLHRPLLLLGSGGGFTGTWTGLGVTSNGQVFSWQGNYPDSLSQTPIKQLKSDELERLKDLLSQLPPSVSDPGNFSFSIKVQQKEWVWHAQSKTEAELSTWFETLTTVIDNNQEYVK